MRKPLAEKIVKSLGPVVLSAFSILICFFLLDPLARTVDPSYTLFASKGVGKITSTLIVILHIMLLASTWPAQQWQLFKDRYISFFINKPSWIYSFGKTFVLFFFLHTLLLVGITLSPFAQFVSLDKPITLSLIGSCIFGFVATFFLALTEELVFRGLLLMHLKTQLKPLATCVVSAIIFSLAHNITAPWLLIYPDTALGIGLFLLGLLLALLATGTGSLAAGMGLHAGLVYVKVVLRRIPLITYTPDLPWWLSQDLRQAALAHALFLIAIIAVFLFYRKAFILKSR